MGMRLLDFCRLSPDEMATEIAAWQCQLVIDKIDWQEKHPNG